MHVGHQGGFAQDRRWHDRAVESRSFGGEQGGQGASDGAQPTVERQFAEQNRAGQFGFGDYFGCGEHATGQRHVVAGTALGQCCRGHGDRHLPLWPGLAAVADGGPHAIL